MTPQRHSSLVVEPHLAALDSVQWSELEQIIERFETVWQSGATPSIKDYVPDCQPSRSAVLCELVATDLEWRWRSGLATPAESYLSEFPELGSAPQTLVQLAASEFVARQHSGLATDVGQLVARFPGVAEPLRVRLAEMTATGAMEPLRLRSGTAPGQEWRNTGKTDDDGAMGARSTDTDAATADVPCRVGRYDLVRRIGGGSFGTVSEATDTELGRRVAVKLPRHNLGPGSQQRVRFVREAQNLARLSHPAIVPVLDAGWCDELFYIVCSLVDGPTLADRLRDGPLEPRAAAQIMATIAGALDHAHRQGIVHRDVKPTNILFDDSGSPWLTDFGLATCSDAEATLTMEGQLLGTPAYMAPEQAAGASHRADARSDVYSLGAVLYECLTGQLPFFGSPSAIVDQIRTCEPLPPRRINPRLDREVEMICLKALEKRPGDRYASAAEMARDLRRYLSGEPVRARPPGPTRRLIKWMRRKPATAALTAVVLGAMLTVPAVIWWHNVQLQEALVETNEARSRAETMRVASDQSQRATESLLYAADIRLATNAYLNGDAVETLRRLRQFLPGAARTDRREFAWYRLWSLCHADQQTLRGHDGDVYVVQPLGEGHQLISAGRDGTLRLWNGLDNPTPTILGQYPDELGFAAVSPDGVTLATGGDAGTIRLWNLPTRSEIGHFVGHTDWAVCGVMSPRADQLATAGRDKVIRVWAIPGGQQLAELSGHTSTVQALAYLPTGDHLVSTGDDCTVRLWDIPAKSGSVLATHPLPAFCVACSHDGKRLATTCADRDIYLWDVESGRLDGRLHGHTAPVQFVAFSPDDTRLASASQDCSVRLWNVATLTHAETFIGHASRVWSVSWFPDNVTLASASGDGTVRLWRCDTSRQERVISLPTPIKEICFSAGQRQIWATGRQSFVWVSDGVEPPMRVARTNRDLGFLTPARSADLVALRCVDSEVCLYDGLGSPVRSMDLPMHISAMELSPLGDLLAVGGAPGELHLYELPSLRLRWSAMVARSTIRTIRFTAGSEELLVRSDDKVVMARVSDGVPRVLIETAKVQQQLLRATADPNDRLLAIGCADHAVRIWSIRDGTQLTCLQGHDGAVQALDFSPDGATLASGTSAGAVTLWHVETWQELGSFKTSLAAVNDLKFSADGNTLAIGGRTANDTGQVILWVTQHVDD